MGATEYEKLESYRRRSTVPKWVVTGERAAGILKRALRIN
jgi:hypothetical protein